MSAIINGFYEVGYKFQLLDHHGTALELNKYKWSNVIVEDELIWNEAVYKNKEYKTSGIYLFYKYLLENQLLEKKDYLDHFVELVRQYDTWDWHNIFNNHEPKKWNDLFYIIGKDRFIYYIVQTLSKGKCNLNSRYKFLLTIEQEKIDRYVKSKNKQIIVKNILEYKTGIVFGEQYCSELGNKLCELHPELDFIVIIDMSSAISYRSIGDKIDLGNDVAKVYQGGGHFNAAGNSINDNIREKVIDIIFNK